MLVNHFVGVESFQNFKIQLATEINYFQINSIEIYKNNEINKNDNLLEVMNKVISLSIDSLKETYILLTEKNEMLILELNPIPGFEQVEKLSGKNIARELVSLL